MLTDNPVLVNNIRPTQTIMCVQRSATKSIPDEEALMLSNIDGFGDDIGRTTNYVTSMYDVMAGFTEDSIEYQTLEYRIQSGQLYQQNAIDKIKGIKCSSMPRSWYDAHALPHDRTDEITELYMRIVADKKPYFMRYIYPKLMSDYNSFIKKTNQKCLMEFGKTVSDLMCMDDGALSDEQKQFLKYYYSRIPVSTGDCIMNRICRKVEEFVDSSVKPNLGNAEFDYSFMKSGAEYQRAQYYAILKLYNEHKKTLQKYRSESSTRRMNDRISSEINRVAVARSFRSKCFSICNNARIMCDIVLDICYKHEGTKQFAWDICGITIFANLLEKNNNMLEYPARDKDGEIEYAGERFSMVQKESNRWSTL